MRNQYTRFLVLTFVCVASTVVHAEISYDAEDMQLQKTVAPVWVDQTTPDVSAFQYMIPAGVMPTDAERTVPGVVEVPLVGVVPGDAQAIILRSDGTFAPARYIVRTANTPISSVLALGRVVPDDSLTEAWSYTPEGLLRALVDSDTRTTIQFEYYDNAVNIATVMVRYEQPITTSMLTLSRASNVTLPLEVRIRASTGEGELRNVLANTRQTGDRLTFPQTTADYFEVTFTLTQPLRLSELAFSEQQANVQTRVVRYLEMPGDAPTLYMGPDRQYGTVPSGGVTLTDDRDVLVYESAVQLMTNAAYVAVDADKDAIPDTRDNCPRIANADQVDANGNDVGDVCDDHDRDGRMTSEDNCPDMPNRDQRDTDGDGVGDACDTEESRFTEANPWVPWAGVGIAVLVLAGLLILTVRGKRPEGDSSIPSDESSVPAQYDGQ